MRLITTLTLSIGLLSGCVKTSGNYCDISTTLYFDKMGVIDYLSVHDEQLLKDIVIHNETRAELCG